MSCSGSFFYPEMTRRGRRPAGWQPALADAGVDFSDLPTDRLDIEAIEGAGQQVGADPGSHAHQHRCAEYKCSRCMARFAKKTLWQRHRAAQCYQEIAERARKVPLPGPEKSLLRYRGKTSAELAPLTCYADLEVYSTPAPTVHIAQQQPARQTVAASACYVAVGRCGYVRSSQAG